MYYSINPPFFSYRARREEEGEDAEGEGEGEEEGISIKFILFDNSFSSFASFFYLPSPSPPFPLLLSRGIPTYLITLLRRGKTYLFTKSFHRMGNLCGKGESSSPSHRSNNTYKGEFIMKPKSFKNSEGKKGEEEEESLVLIIHFT